MKKWIELFFNKRNANHVLTESEKEVKHLPYIFVIGFNKTGTTSLHHFFEGNGFPSIHWDDNRLATTMVENCLHDRRILEGYDQKYRVFSDMIVQKFRIRFEANSLFRILDTDYPGSYFIYNNRKIEDWIASRWQKPCRKYNCTNVELEMRILNTKDTQDVIDTWKKEKLDFEKEVRRYFSSNPKFLELDITAPDVPQQISKLLGRALDLSQWRHYRTNQNGKPICDPPQDVAEG